MDRLRIASIVSGTAASVAAFLVVSRWDLAGTLVGAAIMPVVGALVSHWSLTGMEKINGRARARLYREDVSRDTEELERGTVVEPNAHREKAPSRPRRLPLTQWALAVMSCLALAVSVYAVSLPDPAAETIVRERVIEKTVEKTVTVTTEAGGHLALEPGDGDTGTAPTVTTAPVATTLTTVVGSEPQPAEETEEQPSTPTTVDVPAPEDEPSSPQTAAPTDAAPNTTAAP